MFTDSFRQLLHKVLTAALFLEATATCWRSAYQYPTLKESLYFISSAPIFISRTSDVDLSIIPSSEGFYLEFLLIVRYKEPKKSYATSM